MYSLPQKISNVNTWNIILSYWSAWVNLNQHEHGLLSDQLYRSWYSSHGRNVSPFDIHRDKFNPTPAHHQSGDSVTLVSKKFFFFFRSISSDIQENGFSAPGNRISIPICWQRLLVTNRRYPLSWFVFHECILCPSLSSTASWSLVNQVYKTMAIITIMVIVVLDRFNVNPSIVIGTSR